MIGLAHRLRRKGAGLAAVVPAGTYTRTAIDPAYAYSTITFSSAGTWSSTGGLTRSGTWKTGSGTGADYWIRWTTTAGTLTTGTAGTWQQLSTDRAFGRNQTILGSASCTGTVEIATDAAGTNIIATGTIVLVAEVIAI